MAVTTTEKSAVAELLRQKRYPEAVAAADAYLGQHPEDAAVTHALGTALYRMGNHVGAVVAYQRRLQLEPGSAVAHYSLGLARAKTGDRDGALRSLDRALQLDPTLTAAAKKRMALSQPQPVLSPDFGQGMSGVANPTPAVNPGPATAVNKPQPQRRPGGSEVQERAKKGELGRGEVLFKGHQNIRSRPGLFIFALFLVFLAPQVGLLGDRVQAELVAIEGIDRDAVESIVPQVVSWLPLTLILLALALVARAVLTSLFTRYQINTESITIVRGILWRKMDFFYIYEVNSIEYSQGPIEALLNSATLHLVTERIESKRSIDAKAPPTPTILEFKGLGTSAKAHELFYAIRSAALTQEVGMRGNLMR